MGTTSKKDNNLLYILSFSIVIILIIVIIVVAKSCSNKSSDSSNGNTTVPVVSVVETDGAQDATLAADINSFRDIKFNKSHKAVKKFESKQKDTIYESYAVAEDKTTAYMTFKFNKKNSPEFYGTKVNSSDSQALLQYVFNDKDQMYELRLQYGSLSKDAYDKLVTNLDNQYGQHTFSRTLSNGAVENWYKTKKVTITAYYQESGVSVYVKKN
jgi:alpha-galactosidase/6-phospho-beta-glucosidase family protein